MLLPYENSQPINLTMNNQIQRIPPLATQGQINPEFQEFFNKLSEAFKTDSFDAVSVARILYKNSSQSVDQLSFVEDVCSTWNPVVSKYNRAHVDDRGVDLEVNVMRFQKVHRNIIGGFNLSLYYIEHQTMGNIRSTSVHQVHTELLYTYKNKQFYLLPAISPFVEEDGD